MHGVQLMKLFYFVWVVMALLPITAHAVVIEGGVILNATGIPMAIAANTTIDVENVSIGSDYITFGQQKWNISGNSGDIDISIQEYSDRDINTTIKSTTAENNMPVEVTNLHKGTTFFNDGIKELFTDGQFTINLTTSYTELTLATLDVVNKLFVQIYDQDTGNLLGQAVNITVNNGLQEYKDITDQTLMENLTIGTVYLLDVVGPTSSATYTFTYGLSLVEQAYKMYLTTQTTKEALFTIRDQATSPLQNVQVTMEAYVGGEYQLISAKSTNILGQARFDVIEGNIHRINISKSGYNSQSFELDMEDDEYTITMSQTSDITFNNEYSDVLYSFTPQAGSVFANETNFTFTVRDLSDNLEYFGFNLVRNGTTLHSSNITTDSDGRQLNTTIDLSGYNGSIVAMTMFFKKDGFDPVVVSVNYYVVPAARPYGSLFDARQWAIDNLSTLQRLGVWVLFMLFAIFIVAEFVLVTNTGKDAAIILLIPINLIVAYFVGLPLLILGFLAVIEIMAGIFLTRSGGIS